MTQYKSFIQIIIIIIKKDKSQKVGECETDGRERLEEREIFLFFLSSLLSQIYGNRTVNFCRSRRQSWSTR